MTDYDEEEPAGDNLSPAGAITDPEDYLIGACLLDEGATLDKAIQAGLTTADLLNPRRALTYGALRQLRAKQIPIGIDTLFTELGHRLDDAGGLQELMALDGPLVGTTLHAGHYIRLILDRSARARVVRHARDLIARVEKGEMVPELEERKSETPAPRHITGYAYPSDDDPNTLLGNDDYLGRGGGLLFVSHAGAGKSSWIMDACMMWALGRPWMGIKCNGPLKSLIIQAEDSDRYIGKIFASFAHVNRLTPQEVATLGANCLILRLKGRTGPDFERDLAVLVQAHAPDLVAINPIYLYAEGDITRSEFAQPFLVGLDRVNKDEKFAYILIHHTGKPAAKGKDGRRAETEDWESAYMGFGSSYFANWPRATILLEPVAGNPGHYHIKLGKGGLNAGVTRQVPQGAGFRAEPSTRISVRHSRDKMAVGARDRPVFYWEVDDEAQEDKPAAVNPGGRPSKYRITDFLKSFPKPGEPGKLAAQIHRVVAQYSGIPVSSFKDLCNRAAMDGLIRREERPSGEMVFSLET